MSRELEIYTDGACSGNPGLSGIGVVIKENGNIVKEMSKDLGEATNNIAEYMAVIYALQEALILRADKVILKTDSELVYKQCIGKYKVKHANIKPLFDQVKHLFNGFKEIKIQHIPRDQNKDADGLARKAVKKEQTKKVVAPASLDLWSNISGD